MKRKELIDICKERSICYATNMTKQQMVDVLTMNDENPSIKAHPTVRAAITSYQNKYRDSDEAREKARECSKRWRKNNPEKGLEYWLKWQTQLQQLENQ